MSSSKCNALQISNFYQQRLNLSIENRKHHTVVFHDVELPTALLDGLQKIKRTQLHIFKVDQRADPANILRKLGNSDECYISVHDFLSSTVYDKNASAREFIKASLNGDYTCFEFPRFGYKESHFQELLSRYVASDPIQEQAYADRFFDLLLDDHGYTVDILSGPEREYKLSVKGPAPWMELCGPLMDGDLRFAPGSELFYNGNQVDGAFYCKGALNLLPIRGMEIDGELCGHLIELGKRLPHEPFAVTFNSGKLMTISGEGKLAEDFSKVLFTPAYQHLVEVGIGLMPSALPFIYDWAAPSNEGAPGVHLGFGANPGNVFASTTSIHMDVVNPEAEILVNGKHFFKDGKFALS
jgi:hypothetical protein